MPTTETIKQERMHIRLDTQSKAKAESIITLSPAGWGLFVGALENPPAKKLN